MAVEKPCVRVRGSAVAENALKALADHRYDPRIRERTADAVAQNGIATLRELYAKRFGAKE